MKKRLFTVLLMLVLCVGVLSITALADGDPAIVAQGTCGAAGNEDNVTWVLTDDGTITFSGTGAMADYPMNNSSPWKDYSTSVQKVSFEEGITNVGSYAFSNFKNITDVSLSSSVKEIGNNAFQSASAITNFSFENITTIGASAFQKCNGLTTIKLNSITSIGDKAFHTCTGLTKVEIGGSAVSIGYQTFYKCSALKEVDFSKVKSIGQQAFVGSGLTGTVDLSNVETIDMVAFQNVMSMTGVIFGKNLVSVGSIAFFNTGITELTIPQGNPVFEAGVFQSCTSLTKVTIEPGLAAIKSSIFWGDTALTSIVIPKSVLSIEDNAFNNCTALATVTYGGTEEEWNQITFGTGNDYLTGATINFYSFADEKPTVKAETEKKTGKIKLTITGVDEAKSYKIFVSEQPNGTYTEAATVTGTTYTYSGTPGKTYYFKVQAVNDKGELSGESNIVSKVQLPAQVTSLKATSKKKQVTLKWKKVTGAKKYVIYMSKNGKSGWKKVGTTTKNTYVYKKGTVGKKLYFKVQALTANNKKGEFSKVVSVKVKK